MRTRHLAHVVGLRLAALGLLLVAGCSGITEVTVHNATKSPITATVRVDRVGTRGTPLASDTLKPGQQTTLSSDSAPMLEYVELAISRAGDLGDVPMTKRVPRGKSAWTVASDSESWTGFTIIEGVEGPMSTVTPVD